MNNEIDFLQRPSQSLNPVDILKGFSKRAEFKIAIGVIVSALFIGYFATGFFRQTGPSISLKQSAPTTKSATQALSSTKIKVYIVGEIKNPGVYEIENNSRLSDLLLLAGNATSNANLMACNLASFLSDGMKVAIPSNGSNSGDCGGSVASASAPLSNESNVSPKSALVNLNTATQSELESLPGVGPSYAKAMLEFRQSNGSFKSVSDLRKVKGIGDKRYEDLKDLVTV